MVIDRRYPDAQLRKMGEDSTTDRAQRQYRAKNSGARNQDQDRRHQLDSARPDSTPGLSA